MDIIEMAETLRSFAKIICLVLAGVNVLFGGFLLWLGVLSFVYFHAGLACLMLAAALSIDHEPEEEQLAN